MLRRIVTLFYAPHKYSYLLTYLLTYDTDRQHSNFNGKTNTSSNKLFAGY